MKSFTRQEQYIINIDTLYTFLFASECYTVVVEQTSNKLPNGPHTQELNYLFVYLLYVNVDDTKSTH